MSQRITKNGARQGVKNAMSEIINEFLATRSASIIECMLATGMPKDEAIQLVEEVILELTREYETYRAFERKHEL